MKLVEFTRPMAPHGAGDTRLVDDDTADRLVIDGDAVVKHVFAPESAGPVAVADQPVRRPVGRPRKYLTR